MNAWKEYEKNNYMEREKNKQNLTLVQETNSGAIIKQNENELLVGSFSCLNNPF